MKKLFEIFNNAGAGFRMLVSETFKLLAFILNIFRAIVTPPFHLKTLFKQMWEIGFHSIPIVAFTALFAGMVLALQSYSGFSRFSAESAIATVVIIALTRELGPVFTGLMVSGRSGAAISAEIGTMKVSEQIDALKTLSTDPFRYLIVPRVIASIIVMPFLTLIADVIGVFGGFFVSVKMLGFNPYIYIQNSFEHLLMEDVISGLIKSAVFGAIISIVACYKGYYSEGGAAGVGKSTKASVVVSSILILMFNYILTAILFS